MLLNSDVANVGNIKEKSPLIKGFTQQRRTMFRLGIDRHSNNGVKNRNILRFSEFLLDFDELMLTNDEHVAKIADSTRSRRTMGDLNVLQRYVTLFEMLHKFPE